ncbi:hypothetical protein VTH82DRAFT_7096 [Thermothelomyces myriococcoides]
MSDNQKSPSIEDLTPEEASRIIHSHRKVRYGTACWPCRQRKVKCDNKNPCENCVKREHPQLCSYKPNRSAPSGKSGSTSSEHSMSGRKRPRSPDRQESRSQSKEARDAIRAYDPDNTETARYVGQNSIPALLREQTSVSEPQEVNGIRQDMRSLLGLDNSAPFPLMSARHLDRLTLDISSELPSDREVMNPRCRLPIPRLSLPRADEGLAKVHSDIISLSPARKLSAKAESGLNPSAIDDKLCAAQ